VPCCVTPCHSQRHTVSQSVSQSVPHLRHSMPQRMSSHITASHTVATASYVTNTSPCRGTPQRITWPQHAKGAWTSIAAGCRRRSEGAGGEAGDRREGSIVSFKRVEVAVGAVDVRLEELFLEAALLYASQLPLQDLWQTQVGGREGAGLGGAAFRSAVIQLSPGHASEAHAHD
jgi:hypothetical protein